MMLGAGILSKASPFSCSMILGKSFNYDFNLFVYKMRGSGYMVPMISFQSFGSIIF